MGDHILIPGDCLVVLPELEPNSVHLCATDPPYFIDGMDDRWDHGKLSGKAGHAGIVKGLPVGMKFDPAQGRRLQDFFYKFSLALISILVPGAFLLAFMQPRLYHRMAVAVEDAGFEVRDLLFWMHSGGQGKAFRLKYLMEKMDIPEEEKEALISSTEGGKTPQFRPEIECIMLAKKPGEGTIAENWKKWKAGLIWNEFPEGQQSDVLRFRKPRKKSPHPTPKPVELMERLVEMFSRPGQAVIDPFMGSGTTGVACANTGRRFVGIERNEEYFIHAKERILGPERFSRETLGLNGEMEENSPFGLFPMLSPQAEQLAENPSGN